MILPTWKLAAEVLAGCAAVGISAATIFGADSAPKPRAVPPPHPSVRHRATPTSTTPTTLQSEVPTAVDGGFSGSSGGSGGGLGEATVGSFVDSPTTTAAGNVPADPGPPPTVPESEFPVALPISAVVIVGGGVGVVAWNRRRRTREVPRR